MRVNIVKRNHYFASLLVAIDTERAGCFLSSDTALATPIVPILTEPLTEHHFFAGQRDGVRDDGVNGRIWIEDKTVKETIAVGNFGRRIQEQR